MSERCATRTTSCASAAWSMGSVGAQFPRPLEQPPFDPRRPCVGGRGDAADEHRRAARLRMAEIGSQVAALAAAHLVEGGDGPLHGGFGRVGPPRRRPPPRGTRSRMVRACGSRSRSPGVSGPCTRPRVARGLEGAGRARATKPSFNSTTGVGPPRSCTDTLHLDAAARQPLLQQRPHPRFERRRRAAAGAAAGRGTGDSRPAS